MAKTARRLVASDHQSSPIISHYSEKQRKHRSAIHSAAKPVSETIQDATNTTHHISRKNNSKNAAHFSKKNQTHLRYHSPTPYTPPEHFYIINATEPPSLEQAAAERERIRVEFFATYDVMTGVRIAATLGGFFGLMVFLVVYKSRGETHETMKALKDPKIAAVAAAVMQEEEDRELQEAMEATGMSIYPDDYADHYVGYHRRRMMSLGNVSAPPVLNRGYRLSSIGGYSSLLGPNNRRFSYGGGRRKSSSIESSRIFSAYPMGGSFGIDDYFIESDGDEADDEFDQITNSVDIGENQNQYQLSVPPKGQESRRCSNITCCSSESSYLERRCSAITLGLTSLPPISSRYPSRCPSTTDMWDYFCPPPDIQVIQATPKTSPCPSDRGEAMYYDNGRKNRKIAQKSLSEQESFDLIAVYPDNQRPHHYDEIEEEELAETAVLAQHISKLSRNHRCLDDSIIMSTVNNTLQTNLLSNRRAPLASLSSLKISSIDFQDSDLRSLGSDSVFVESYADTDDDMEQFSTDSDAISEAQHLGLIIAKPLRSSKIGTQRCSTVCADIELKPRDLITESCEMPNITGTKLQGKSSKDCTSHRHDASTRVTKKSAQRNIDDVKHVLKPIVLSTKRPASYSGSTEFHKTKITSGNDDQHGTDGSSSSQTNDSINNNTKQLYLSSSNNNFRCSKSTSNMADKLLQQKSQSQQQHNIATPLSLNQYSQLHGSQQPYIYQSIPLHHSFNQMENSSRKILEQCNNRRGSNSETIKIAMSSTIAATIQPTNITVDNRQRQLSSIVNPSVILELPVIVSPQESTLIEMDPTIDPSLPSTSRKWSKETLF